MSVPNYGGEGRANTFAETLAEAVPNAAVVIAALMYPRPANLESRIDIEPHVDAGTAERFKNAPDPVKAASALREAGLCEEDIRDITAARLDSVIASSHCAATVHPRERAMTMDVAVADADMPARGPVDPAPRAATTDAAALSGPQGRDRSPQSLALLLVKAAERVRTDPAENFAHCAVRGAADVLRARLDDRTGAAPDATSDSMEE